MDEPSQAVPIDVPVVVNIGKPIVDMPGCVTVHKENVKNRSKNKMLVNDDPKGNTTLCDSGMPSFQPVDYQSQGLTWTTVVPEEPEPDGVDSNHHLHQKLLIHQEHHQYPQQLLKTKNVLDLVIYV